MDIPTLIRTNIDQLRNTRDQFYAAADPARKKAAYDGFMEAITNLHKISKGVSMSEGPGVKLREIIVNSVKDAEQMKGALGVAGNTLGVPQSNSLGGRSPTPNKNDSAAKPKTDNDKDKAAFQEALQGAIISEKPNVKWEDVAGLKVAKQTLKEAIIFPTKFPDIFVGLRKPWKGILLYGVR